MPLGLLHRTRLAVVLGVALLCPSGLSGCGSDDVGPRSHMVGGRCMTDNDCVKRCAAGSQFPGGYCTVTCSSDNDCPGGSACINDNGGICVATCQLPADCHAYGPAYQCSRQTSQGGDVAPLVCVGT
jgi:hypothetical protein